MTPFTWSASGWDKNTASSLRIPLYFIKGSSTYLPTPLRLLRNPGRPAVWQIAAYYGILMGVVWLAGRKREKGLPEQEKIRGKRFLPVKCPEIEDLKAATAESFS